MGSREPEELCNTETEEGTVALQKKRSRRVSFAEITSVHVFDRDEDCETPPDSKPPSSSDIPQSHQPDDATPVLGFIKDSADSDDSKEEFSQNEDEDEDEDEDDDDDVVHGGASFLRPRLSPSPGSTVGSATSNNEDNFFGPVSASFIRLRGISDSATSDENHDITMDSTAFSMHFRSLARSELGGDAKTPTGVHLPFEEKTPTQNTTSANAGCSMVLTGDKKTISLSPVDKVRGGGGDSNDMSLIGENPHRYDFGRFSPELDAILAEGSKDLHPVSISDEINVPKQSNKLKRGSMLEKHGTDIIDSRDYDHIGPANNSNYDMSVGTSSAAFTRLCEPNSDSVATPIDRITPGCESSMIDALAADASIDQTLSLPRKGMSLGESQHSINYELERSRLKLVSAINNGISSLKDNKVLKLDLKAQHESGNLSSTEGLIGENSPKVGRHISSVNKKSTEIDVSALAGSISLLSAERRKSFLDTSVSSGHPWKATSSSEQLSSVTGKEQKRHGESGSSIKESISRFKIPMVSPDAFTFKDGASNAKLWSSDFLSRTPPPSMVLVENSIDPPSSHLASALASRSEGHVLIAGQKNKEHETTIGISDDISETPKLGHLSQTKESIGLVNDGDSLYRTLGHIKSVKAASTPQKLVSSPLKMKLSVPQGFHGNPSRDLQQQDQRDKLVSFASGQYGDFVEDVPNATESAVIVDKFDFLPSVGIGNFKVAAQMERIDDRAIASQDLQNESRASKNFQTPPRNSNDLSFQLENPDNDLLIGTDPARFMKVHPEGGTGGSVFGSASPYVRRIFNEQDIQSPSRDGSCNASDNYSMNRSVEGSLSSTSSQHRNRHGNNDLPQGLDILKTRVQMHDFEASLGRKRKAEEMFFREHMKENARTWSSSKIHKGGCHDLKFPLESNSKLKHWNDIFAGISGDTKQLLSPLTDKLNLEVIDMLEDNVVYLLKVKMYGSLCSEYRPQKVFDASTDVTQRRIAETRLVMYKMAYERAKLQLLCLKRGRLLKRVNLLSSGIAKSRMFNLILSQHLFVPGAAGAQMDDRHSKPCSFNSEGKNQLQCDEVTAMKQELEASDRKMKSLTKMFHTSCNMKEEQNCVDSIMLVNDHLKRRMCCRFIRQDLQLWKLDGLESRHSHHSVVLNYNGLISQRLIVNAGHIVVANKSSDTNILKKFPNMDALTAYAFVLNAESSWKYVGRRNLAKETQKTSSLLSNLLDVVEEVQLAQTELKNLTSASFHSPAVANLHLELCFIDYMNGRKAVLTLDMTSLNRGVYPSEILPSEIQVPVGGSEESLPQSLSAEIKGVLGSLRAGYARIIRLCRCVSDVVEASK